MTRLAVVALLALGACGGSDLRAVSEARLQIEIRADDEGALDSGILQCDGQQARGTGIYEQDAVAAAACDAVRSNPVVQRLLFSEPDPGRACTEEYGGPQRAKIAGVVDGVEVDVSIARADGCGIDDWRALEPLIGPPPDPPVRDATSPGA